MLAISSPNTDRSLLTLAQLRAAVGIDDNSKDAELTALGRYVSATLTKACRVRTADAIPPTLRLETVEETIELLRCEEWLTLARNPVVSITSITENDTVLDSTDYRLVGAAGRVQRRSGSCASYWVARRDIVVIYAAGWDTVPDDLIFAAIKFAQIQWQTGDRDPLLRRKRTEGVSEYEWWVDPTKENVVPADVMNLLDDGGFVNEWAG